MRVLFVTAYAIAIAGCSNPNAALEQQAAQAAHYEAVTMCDQPDRADEWKANCYKMVMSRRQSEFTTAVAAQQQQNQARMSQALMNASGALLATPPPPPMVMNTPVNCTSTPVGGSVHTNCR